MIRVRVAPRTPRLDALRGGGSGVAVGRGLRDRLASDAQAPSSGTSLRASRRSRGCPSRLVARTDYRSHRRRHLCASSRAPGSRRGRISAGLPGGAYFIAGRDREHRDCRSPSSESRSSAESSARWSGRPCHRYSGTSSSRSCRTVWSLAGVTVLTQLVVVTAKACSQGTDDLRGANASSSSSSSRFFPPTRACAHGDRRGYGGRREPAYRPPGDGVLGWGRLARRDSSKARTSFVRTDAANRALWPSRPGRRGVTLFNLRLDFVLMNVITGPAVLGVYAVASKFAELVRFRPWRSPTCFIQGTRATIRRPRRDRRDTDPEGGRPHDGRGRAVVGGRETRDSRVVRVRVQRCRHAHADHSRGARTRRRRGGRHCVPVRHRTPGAQFRGDGGRARVTVALDLLLIPRFDAMGAAIASAVAYATSALALVWCFWWVNRPERASEPRTEAIKAASAGTP